MAREVVKDTELNGCPIKAGNMVLLSFPAANRDPAMFENADQVVIDRKVNRHAAFGLGIALAVTDFFDGRVARRSNVVSRSGAFLDPLADKIVVIGGAYCLVYVERYWWVPVTIIALRELGITAYRSRWAREGLALPARTSAKYKTFVQALALILAVMPTLEDHDTVIVVSLWVAVGWTIYSGVQYPRWAKCPEHHRRLTPEASDDPLGGTHVNDLAEAASEM